MPLESVCGADDLANNLFTELTTGIGVTLPVVDLSGAEFSTPAETGNVLYGEVNTLSEADLTTRKVDGTGVFDGLMQALNAHLRQEFEKGRITGKEYSSAYISLTTAALTTATQYLLGRDTNHWQAQLLQKQARAAEIAAVNSRLLLEITKAELSKSHILLDTAKADYASSKMSLATGDAQYCLLTAQKVGVEQETSIKAYQLASILPGELSRLTAETAVINYEVTSKLPAEVSRINADTSISQYQVANILPAELDKLVTGTTILDYQLSTAMPAEVAKVGTDTAIATYRLNTVMPKEYAKLDYEVTSILPKELLKLQNQIDIGDAGISLTTAQTGKANYEISAILPAQLLGIQEDTGVKKYQHDTFLPAQVAGFTADTAGKLYSNEFILPAQLVSVNEQTESHRAKTHDYRLDGITLVAGAIGKQKDLHAQQIESYKRDSEAKVAKFFLDTWITRKSMDTGVSLPTSMEDPAFSTLMTKMRTNADLD